MHVIQPSLNSPLVPRMAHNINDSRVIAPQTGQTSRGKHWKNVTHNNWIIVHDGAVCKFWQCTVSLLIASALKTQFQKPPRGCQSKVSWMSVGAHKFKVICKRSILNAFSYRYWSEWSSLNYGCVPQIKATKPVCIERHSSSRSVSALALSMWVNIWGVVYGSHSTFGVLKLP